MNLQAENSVEQLMVENIASKSGSFLWVGRDKQLMHETIISSAKRMACSEKKGDDFCGQCRDCQLIETGQHPDICWIRPSGGSAKIKIEDIRILKEKINLKPFQASRKLFIICDAQRMGPEAANALLKTLEEPPQDASLLLIADSVSELLPTVVSRCQLVRFYRSGSQGSKEQDFDLALLKRFFVQNTAADNLSLYEDVASCDRGEVEKLLYELACILRDILIYNFDQKNIRLLSCQSNEDIKRWAVVLPDFTVEQLLEEVLKTKKLINKNANIKLAVDLLIKKFDQCKLQAV
jgi:DNA polymerase III gamma/tau subunit